MKHNDQLHRLVRSLSPPEKAYFKRQRAQQNGGAQPKYIRLFDLLQGQDQYDEDLVISNLGEDDATSHFAVAKKYLYDAILKSVRSYRGAKSIRHRVLRFLDEAEILYEKGLVSESRQALRKARKLGYKTDEFISVLQVIDLEKRISGVHNLRNLNRYFQRLLDDESEVLEKIENLNAIQRLYYQLFAIIKKERGARSRRDLQRLRKIKRHELLNDISLAQSFRARVTFCTSNTFYYDMVGDYNAAYDYAEKLVRLWDDKPVMIREQPEKYMSANINMLNRCLRLDKTENFPPYIERLRSIRPDSFRLEVRLFEYIAHFELAYWTNRLNDEALDAAMARITEGLEEYGRHINPNMRNVLLYNIGINHMSSGRWSDALDQYNAILSVPKAEIHTDVYRFCIILPLIIHLETGEAGMLDSQLRAAHRLMQGSDRPYRVERSVVDFLRKALTNWQQDTMDELQQDFLLRLRELRKDPLESPAFEYFDFVTWMESRLCGLTIRGTFRKRATQERADAS